jgi:2-polyprenyl-3-methyl-5-hydroxy-6-metoxy-1,4-benzoquinol methylase
MKEFWDRRYASEEYVYGMDPNDFFKQIIDETPPAKLLLPGEGEGRNAVYAASKGWQVDAFDISQKGKDKALKRARSQKVKINYKIAEYTMVMLPIKEYDLIGLIYCHMHKNIRRDVHAGFISSLKEGGSIFLEAFSKAQLHRNSGGPKDLNMLFSVEELREDFNLIQIEFLDELILNLDAGNFHRGEASIIRMIAKKSN